MRIKPLYLLFAASLILGSVIYFALQKKEIKPQEAEQNTQVLQKEDGSEVSFTKDNKTLNIKAGSYEWKLSQEQTVDISFKTLPSPPPAAITLKLRYDPSALKVERAEPGNLWGKTNILKTDIDNTEGFVEYSLGQGFDTQPTGDSTIAKIVISPIQLNNERTTLEVTSESVMAFIGIRELVSLESSSLDIKITE